MIRYMTTLVYKSATNMKKFSFCIAVTIIVLMLKCHFTEGKFLVIPEDVPAGFAAIYGFTPRFIKANDHRLGFGFRFGNHADLQVLYELGPQTVTQPLQPTLKVRSARVRERVVRKRPLLEFLLRAGFLRDSEYEVNFNECNEPR